MSDHLTYYIGINGEHRWKVQAEGNHEITLDSTEGYVDRGDAEANANRYLTLHATDDPDVFEVDGRGIATAADLVAKRCDEYYGVDLFPLLPPEFDWALLDRWLADTFGFRIDRLSAEYYRRAYASIEGYLRDEAGDDA